MMKKFNYQKYREFLNLRILEFEKEFITKKIEENKGLQDLILLVQNEKDFFKLPQEEQNEYLRKLLSYQNTFIIEVESEEELNKYLQIDLTQFFYE